MARATEILLRRTIRGMLRESEGQDLSGKSLSRVAELVEINRRLRDAGLAVEAGLMSSSGGMKSFSFAIRSLDPEGDPGPVMFPSGVGARLGVVAGALPLEEKDARRAVEAAQDLIEEIPWGRIEVRRPRSSEGECSGAFTVNFTSHTKNGWGPLLYDLAMEWASLNGGGLMSDRGSVSSDAQAVWDKYSTSRRKDVEAVQLDILPGFLKHDPVFWGTEQLTPDVSTDDCDQFPTGEHSKGGGDWKYSPLSRAYRKTDNEVTRTLSDLGLLW